MKTVGNATAGADQPPAAGTTTNGKRLEFTLLNVTSIYVNTALRNSESHLPQKCIT